VPPRVHTSSTERKQLGLLVVICALTLSAACATGTPTAADRTVMIDDVPFFSQEAYQCGPTALSIVIDYWYGKTGAGKWLTPEEIAAEIYSPTARGVLGFDLENYGKRHGFETQQYAGTIVDLKQKVDAGVPVIIFVDYGMSVYQVNHFMVVTGYTGNGVVVNSGSHQRQIITDKELERIWKKNRYWSLVLRPLSSSS
jgi:predicted double-glycine peptidase